MTPTDSPSDGDLWSAWFLAAEDDNAGRDLQQLFDGLDERVRARGPTCWTSGRCCKFDSFGHLLYVTGLEIAWVMQRVPGFASRVPRVEKIQATHSLPMLVPNRGTRDLGLGTIPPACEYQIDGLCSIHAIRPMGCRVFFCQEGTAEWQNELYEQFLGRLRSLHDRFSIPYRYMEWRGGLIQANQHRSHPAI